MYIYIPLIFPTPYILHTCLFVIFTLMFSNVLSNVHVQNKSPNHTIQP